MDDRIDDGQLLVGYYLLCELEQWKEESFKGHLELYLGLCGVEGVVLWGSSLDESGLGDAVFGGSVAESDAVPVLVVGSAEAHFVGLDELPPQHFAIFFGLIQQHFDVVNNLVVFLLEESLSLTLAFGYNVWLEMIHDGIL